MLDAVLRHLEALVSFDTRNPPRLIGTGGIFDYIRAQLPDFRIDGPEVHAVPGLVNLLGIESPGLTSSLAIAELVVRRLAA